METGQTHAARVNGKELAVIGIILSLAIFLRLFRLGSNSLWLDESVSIAVAQSPISQILTSARLDSQPPLYALLLHFWLPAGSSEFMLRFPSLFFGVLSVGILYRFARCLLRPGVALLSAFLLAISPLHVWYSQEVRSYILATLFGLASTYFFSGVLSKGKRVHWLAYIGVTLAGLYTNYGMILVVAGQNLYLLISSFQSRDKRLALTWLIGQGVLLLGFSPWLPYISDSLREAVKDYQTLNTILQITKRFGLDLGEPVLVWTISALALIALALTVVTGYGLWACRRRLEENQVALLSLILGAYTIVTLLSAIPQGASIRRQLLIFLPFFLLAVPLAASRLKLATAHLVILAFLVAAPALSANYFLNQKEQWREVAQLVESRGREGDLVLLHAGWATDPFRHYYTGGLPYKGTPLEGLSTELKQAVSTYERVWLILSNDRYRDPQGDVKRWFDGCYKTELSSDFAYITVRLYEVARLACTET